MVKELILRKIIDYLKLIKWEYRKAGKVTMLKCPFCNTEPISANLIPNTSTTNCFACNKKYDLIDIVRQLEPDKKDLNEEDVLQYLKEKLKIDVTTEKEENDLDAILTQYEKLGFDLVPVGVKCSYCNAKGCDKCDNTGNYGKNPIEDDWTHKSHKNKAEWSQWLASGLNLGLKVGAISNVTVIDVDTKEVDKELKKLLSIVQTLEQETKKGHHYIFKYDSDFPKTRINELKVDIETDGGQIVIYPSVSLGHRRTIKIREIKEMPSELKKFLMSKVTVPRKTNSEKIKEDIQEEKFNLDLVKKGEGRSNFLIKMGGVYRKYFNMERTRHIIKKLNQHLCNPPIPDEGIEATVLKSLENYVVFDQQDLAHEIIEYLKDVKTSTKSELELAISGKWTTGETKKRFNRTLEYLVKEDKIILKDKKVELVKDLEWNNELFNLGIPINFKMPYFNSYAYFNWQDVVVIASKTGYGKTHLAMNIVKRLVNQGVKPYYIYSETGGRFAKNALKLGMTPNQFLHAPLHDPRKFRLPKNMKRPVIIYDWFRPHDWAKTDEIFERLLEKIKKVDGFMILFMQLKHDNSYFAINMLEQFPAWVCKYLYEDDNRGVHTKFKVTKIREAKIQGNYIDIPCIYDWDSKQVKLIEELSEEEKAKVMKKLEKDAKKT